MKSGDAGIFPVYYSLKAVVNYVGGLLASRRFLLVTVRIFLFLVDQLRRKHLCSLDGRRFARLEACFLLLLFVFFCFRSTNSDESILQNTRIKKSRKDS